VDEKEADGDDFERRCHLDWNVGLSHCSIGVVLYPFGLRLSNSNCRLMKLQILQKWDRGSRAMSEFKEKYKDTMLCKVV
jgi:hypothetical protein